MPAPSSLSKQRRKVCYKWGDNLWASNARRTNTQAFGLCFERAVSCERYPHYLCIYEFVCVGVYMCMCVCLLVGVRDWICVLSARVCVVWSWCFVSLSGRYYSKGIRTEMKGFLTMMRTGETYVGGSWGMPTAGRTLLITMMHACLWGFCLCS